MVGRWVTMMLFGVGLCAAAGDARADAMCGGPRRRPDPPPPASANPGFARPPPQGALAPAGDGRLASRPPLLPVEVGMVGCMVLLGGAAGVSSRKKKGQP